VSYPAALALTLALELVIVGLLAPRGRRGEVLFACVCVNLLSHPPAAWLLVGGVKMEALEVGVLALETLGYRLALGPGWRRAGGLALAANGITWALSYLV